MTPSPGTRLGIYEIVCPLGAGGVREAYRAKGLRLGRAVAGLNHSNIVTLLSPPPTPLSRVLEFSIPLTDALVAAHERCAGSPR